MIYTVEEIMQTGDDLIGKVITISGCAFVHPNPVYDEDEGEFDDLYVAPDLASHEDDYYSVFLDHHGLIEELRMAGMKCISGGPYGYVCYRCQTRGVLDLSEVTPFPFSLSSLEYVTVWQQTGEERVKKVTVSFDDPSTNVVRRRK